MPDREHLLQRVTNLSEHTWTDEADPEQNQVWTGRESGASFELSKSGGVIYEEQGEITQLILALRGRRKGKEMLEESFIAALGKPSAVFQAKRCCYPRTLLWNWENDDRSSTESSQQT